MDLTFDPEQQMLLESARSFLERRCPTSDARAMERDPRGFVPDLWRDLARLGWLGIDLPEEYGGGGRSFLERTLLMEEMGRALLPSPIVPTCVLAAPLIVALGTAEQRARWLPAIAAGDLVATLALVEPGWRNEWQRVTLDARFDGDALVLSGRKTIVSFAPEADLMLVAARIGADQDAASGVSLIAVSSRTERIAYSRLATLGGDHLYQVDFADVRLPRESLLGKPGEASLAIERALRGATVASLAYALGAAERSLEMTTEYAKTRVQFGRPIGSFQAVAHRCVDMRSDIDGARVLVQQAAWNLATGRSSDLEVSVAKAYGSEALRRIFMNAHQVHGAIGFSNEYDLQLFTRRAKSIELLWGSASFHRERVARAMGLGDLR